MIRFSQNYLLTNNSQPQNTGINTILIPSLKQSNSSIVVSLSRYPAKWSGKWEKGFFRDWFCLVGQEERDYGI